MSIQALQARIEKISSEIVLQEKLLQHLRRDKSLVQRQLNEAVDPVARLPLEISSEIFLHCLTPFPERNPGAHRAPMLFLNVCNTWTTIALSTPRLWSAIEIDFPRPKDLTQQLMPIWLQRAGNHPLSISLGGDLHSVAHCFPTILLQHGRHLRDLVVLHGGYDNENSHESDEWDSDTLDLFGDATLEPLPLLETLIVRSLVDGQGFLAPQILQLLRLSPNLVNFIFHGQFLYGLDIPFKKETLPTLRSLMFAADSDPNDSDDYPDASPPHEILSRLSLPALEALSIGMPTNDQLLCFLKQSAPALQELNLGMMFYHPLNSVQLCECLRLIPNLRTLEMWHPSPRLVADFLTAFADSPSLLSNLRTLAFSPRTTTESSWEFLIQPLLHMFSSRRIELYVDWSLIVNPPAAVLAALAQLAADGAEIRNLF
ncbi:hypothetical protein B0H12DRAFT_1142129 [Mycena haematopus]|nr:hypothetical protein B0H12DRAFT_1142129 [Mycena haematopus]